MIQQLAVEVDEMSSCVQKKANKQWIWIAMDAKSRQVIAFHVGGFAQIFEIERRTDDFIFLKIQ